MSVVWLNAFIPKCRRIIVDIIIVIISIYLFISLFNSNIRGQEAVHNVSTYK